MSKPRDAKRARRAARRAELLDACVGAIREHGPGVSMEQMAAAGDVTKPILYRHFGDRDGLVAAIGASFAEQLTADLASSLAADAGPRDLLESTIDRFVRFVEADPNLYRFLVRQALRRDDGVMAVTGLIETISNQVAVVIGEEMRRLGLDSGAAEPWAYGIVGLVRQAADWWLERQTMPRARLVAYLTDLLWDGLGAGVREAGEV